MSNNICRNFKDRFFCKNRHHFLTKTLEINLLSSKNQPENGYFTILQPLNLQDMIASSNKEGDEIMINQVTLVGRLTRDPELNKTSEGTPVAHITLAVTRHFRNQNGEIEADFVQCTLWRRAAENTSQYCRKGSVVGITGRLQTRNYDNKEGKRVYVTEVIAETIRFLSSKPHSETVPGPEPEPKKEEVAIGG
jgi:single-strand DNA-binding protein